MSLIGVLCELQDVDYEWDEKAGLYAQVRERLSSQPELETTREAQHQLDERLPKARAELRDVELELASLQARRKHIEEDLYGGRIRSPRELESLGQDNEFTRKHISESEDRVLLAMTELEDLQEAIAQGRKELDLLEARWADERGELVSQYQSLRARLQTVLDLRETLRKQLDSTTLALYDELRRSKGGQALAPAHERVCQICRVTVPPSKDAASRRGDSVVTCDGCGRILFPT